MEKYPGRKAYAVDSLCASLGTGVVCVPSGAEKARGHGHRRPARLRGGTQAAHLPLVYGGGSAVPAPRRAASARAGGVHRLRPQHQACFCMWTTKAVSFPFPRVRGRKASLRAIADKVKETMLDRDRIRRCLSAMATARRMRNSSAEMIQERTGPEAPGAQLRWAGHRLAFRPGHHLRCFSSAASARKGGFGQWSRSRRTATCDLSPELQKRYNVTIQPLYIVRDGDSLRDGRGDPFRGHLRLCGKKPESCSRPPQ